MHTLASSESSDPFKPSELKLDRQALESALGEQLNVLLSASRALIVEAAATFHPDLPPAAFHIAYRLRAFGAAKISSVAEAVAMDRSATSRLSARLIECSLIVAHPDPADGRGTVLDLTQLGRTKVDQAIACKGAVFRQKIATLSNTELELLANLLGRFNNHTPYDPELNPDRQLA
jgi:DNA-binding MarR family transcriptional regulator